jgi:hypothetical protein
MKTAFDPIKHVMNLGPALLPEAIMARKNLHAPPADDKPPKRPSAARRLGQELATEMARLSARLQVTAGRVMAACIVAAVQQELKHRQSDRKDS